MTTYPYLPGFKSGSISTSRQAAEAMAPKSGTLRGMVEGLYRRSMPMTADEAADKLGISILTIRPRVSELVRMGRLYDTGVRRKNTSGKLAAVLAVKS